MSILAILEPRRWEPQDRRRRLCHSTLLTHYFPWESVSVSGPSNFDQLFSLLASVHTLLISLRPFKTTLVCRSPDSPVPALVLHRSEMALGSQQHLHISCHRVVKQGIGVPLGKLHSLLQEEVICKAMDPNHSWVSYTCSAGMPCLRPRPSASVFWYPETRRPSGKCSFRCFWVVFTRKSTAGHWLTDKHRGWSPKNLSTVCSGKRNSEVSVILRGTINLQITLTGFCHNCK